MHLPSWLPPGDSICHDSTSERKLISLASQSLREKIIYFEFSKAEGTMHELGFSPLLVSSLWE